MTVLYPNPYYNRCVKGIAPVVTCIFFHHNKETKKNENTCISNDLNFSDVY